MRVSSEASHTQIDLQRHFSDLLHNWKYAIGKEALEGSIQVAVEMAAQTDIVLQYARNYFADHQHAHLPQTCTFLL